MDLLIANAYAQTAASPQGGGLMQLALPILLLVFLYFILIRPQQKQAKEHRKLVAELKKGDEVVIGGGIIGKLSEVGDHYVGLQVAENVELKVQRNSVLAVLPKGTLKNVN